MKQTVRIIGGRYRGKKLHFPAIPGLRPTSDRVKETLFNWLMHDIRGARCLDAFAGSGALGFEAFSRGAEKVFLVESSPQAYANLRQLVSAFKAPNLAVIHAKAEEYLRNTTESFDLVFLDPPFAQNYLSLCLDLLANTDALAKGGLVYIEAPEKMHLDTTRWREIKAKQAGQVNYSLYEKLAS